MSLNLMPLDNAPARNGAVIVYAVIFVIALQAVGDIYLALVSGVTPGWGTAVRIIVTLLLIYGLYRGMMWARMLIIVFGMVGIAFVLAAITSHPWSGISTFGVVIVAVYLLIIAVLVFSPAVRAYESWRQSAAVKDG